MSVSKDIGRCGHAADHACQFFDSEDSRAGAVAEFVADGLRAEEHVLVVARPLHWSAILARLSALGVPANEALSHGQLIVKDAMEVLRRITRNGVAPDSGQFEDIIGTAVRRLAALGPLRVYGEIVDVLAQRNEMGAVMALESLWNGLADSASFSLMCGYAAPHFVSASTYRALREICAAHTTVHQGEHDALAAWLLTLAHNSVASSSSLSH